MKVLLDGILLLAIGLLLATIALGLRWPFTNMGEGELRCESGGRGRRADRWQGLCGERDGEHAVSADTECLEPR
jgi:hypothetical protein